MEKVRQESSDREAVKRKLLAEGALRFEARAARVFRHQPTAVFVRQLLFWDGKGHDPDGYVWKTGREWWDEGGLTRDNVATARRKLIAAGVLDETHKGIPRKLYYRLDLEALLGAMFPELEPPTPDDPVPGGADDIFSSEDARRDSEDGFCDWDAEPMPEPEPDEETEGGGPDFGGQFSTLNHRYRVLETNKQVCGKPTDKFAGNPRSNQESTAEGYFQENSVLQTGCKQPPLSTKNEPTRASDFGADDATPRVAGVPREGSEEVTPRCSAKPETEERLTDEELRREGGGGRMTDRREKE